MTEIKKLPFLFTPPVERYVREIIVEFEKRHQGILENQSILPFSMHFETYRDDEPFLSNSEDMRKALIDYLEAREAVEFEFIAGVGGDRFFNDTKNTDDMGYNGYFDSEFGLHILDIEPLKEIWTYHLEHLAPSILRGRDAGESYELKYDNKTGVLKYYNKHHTFQPRLRPLINELWSKRSHLYLGMDVGTRKYVSLTEIAKALNLNHSLGKTSIQKQLKNLQASLPSKFPIRLEIDEDAILMKIKEV